MNCQAEFEPRGLDIALSDFAVNVPNPPLPAQRHYTPLLHDCFIDYRLTTLWFPLRLSIVVAVPQ
ncbi:hypothetical protein ACTXT7_002779 [Hymenolepis weldensis]